MNAEHSNPNPPFSPDMFARLGAPTVVYVRELPENELAMIAGAETGTKLFAIHSADGTRVGIMNDRAAAFATARQNDMEPVSVH